MFELVVVAEQSLNVDGQKEYPAPTWPEVHSNSGSDGVVWFMRKSCSICSVR